MVPNAYAAALATKGGPLFSQYWNNEAKSRANWQATANYIVTISEKTNLTLGQDDVIIFGHANIDLPGEQSLAIQ